MIRSSRVRKLALATHLTFSVGWIGAVVGYLALGVAAVGSQDAQTVRGAWIAMELIGWYVIVPLAVGSLLTGLAMSLGTKWGLFRYYWVLLAFALTTLGNVILLFHMPTVSSLADEAREAKGTDLDKLGGDLFHPSLGLAVLLMILVLNIYKPPGMTRYGWHKQDEQRRKRAMLHAAPML
ncbi:MAG: DUF2269 domain-containing protein [Nocardioidaceae bacterium]|nr:DUF2269 domain-containing protein [Nocardioidaceae bacterium]